MPLKGVRYRILVTPDGKRYRLAFKGNKVVEKKLIRRK